MDILFYISQITSSISLTGVFLCLAFVIWHYKEYSKFTFFVIAALIVEAILSSNLTHNHTANDFKLRQYINHTSFDIVNFLVAIFILKCKNLRINNNK